MTLIKTKSNAQWTKSVLVADTSFKITEGQKQCELCMTGCGVIAAIMKMLANH